MDVPVKAMGMTIMSSFTGRKMQKEFKSPNFPEAVSVDVLIRLDHYYDFVTEEMKRDESEQPIAIRSLLGWIICGRTNEPADSASGVLKVTTEESTEMALKRLWELDAVGITDEGVKDNSASVQLKRLHETFSYDGNRCTMRLPWKAEKSLPNNNGQAYRGLIRLEDQMPAKSEEAFAYEYVTRHDKTTTTKCRIVFDGSSRYKSVALNDLMEAGPPLQADLVGILLRFRRFKVAVQVDIEKMFMQILLHEEDRDFVRFLWREFDRDITSSVWRFTRVSFGLTGSPFLAIAVINKHAEDNADAYKQRAAGVWQNMYVNDLVSSYCTLEEAISVSDEARKLLKSGRFDLKKWTSSCPEAVARFSDDKGRNHPNVVMTLGIAWRVKDDTLLLRELQTDRLNGENYLRWKFEIEAILETRDCSDLVSGETLCPAVRDDKVKAWKKRDAVARSIISRSLDDFHHAFIRSCKTSKEMTDIIISIKEQATVSNKLLVSSEFHAYTWKPGMNVASLIAGLNTIVNKMQSLNIVLDNAIVVGKAV
ncbi:Zinc knuckle protein [Trichuris trichiura]|uniref:Zinc knuckle protein n=1 Tax=Trichuris trichiura TaxID=36087 RepID=A0A077ZKB3_TRITR|nr:Zinc knuckle protein [Trichuris trichiura]